MVEMSGSGPTLSAPPAVPPPAEIAAALAKRVIGQALAIQEMSIGLTKKLAGLGTGLGHQAVHQRALAHARGAQHQGVAARQAFAQGVQALALLQAQRQHGGAHAPVGREPRPGLLERLAQVLLVEHDEGTDALGLGREQGARELAFGEHGLGRQEDQHTRSLGGCRFGWDGRHRGLGRRARTFPAEFLHHSDSLVQQTPVDRGVLLDARLGQAGLG